MKLSFVIKTQKDGKLEKKFEMLNKISFLTLLPVTRTWDIGGCPPEQFLRKKVENIFVAT